MGEEKKDESLDFPIPLNAAFCAIAEESDAAHADLTIRFGDPHEGLRMLCLNDEDGNVLYHGRAEWTRTGTCPTTGDALYNIKLLDKK